MSEAWIRLSRTCKNACLFCGDADALDGTVEALDDVKQAIDAAVDAGATSIILSGGEPLMSKHALAAIKHVKARGARCAVTTNGRIIQSIKVAEMLEKAGLDEIRVSVHAGRRATHDALVQAKNAWIDSLAGLRYCGRTGMHVIMRSVLTKHNKGELGHLMHLGMMGGMKGMDIMRPQPEGRLAEPGALAKLAMPLRGDLTVIGTMWFDAKEEQILLRQFGWDHTLDAGLKPAGPPAQIDRAGIAMLRQRVKLDRVHTGTLAVSELDTTMHYKQVLGDEGGASQVGHELRARSAPLTDVPWCLGGWPQQAPDAHGDEAVYGDDCDRCPMRARCPGVPRKLGKDCKEHLAPLPAWTGVGTDGHAVLVGGDALTQSLIWPALLSALADEGVAALHTPSVDPEAVVAARLVVCGDAATAAAVLAVPARPEDQQVVVLDDALGGGLEALPPGSVRVVSWVPGCVEALLEAGVSLRDVDFRAVPFPAALADDLDKPTACTRLVALGETADWALLERAVAGCTANLPPIDVYGPGADVLAPMTGFAVKGEVDEATMVAAIQASRAVVVPFRRVRPTPEDRAALARDLRWIDLALAAGRPVIAVRAPGVADHVRHQRDGYLCPSGHPRELTEGLRKIATEQVSAAKWHAGALRHTQGRTVEAWAHGLVHGALPDEDALVKDELHPWPTW